MTTLLPSADFLALSAITDSGLEIDFDPYGDSVSGEYHGGWAAYVDGVRAGHLDYAYARGIPIGIRMVEVDPQFRGRGIATALLARLKAEFPGQEIEPGMLTPDGAAWWRKVSHKSSDRGSVERVTAASGGPLDRVASQDHEVVRGLTLSLDGPERTEVARKIVNGTVTVRDIVFAVHSYDGHAGNWWGPNDGYNWSIEDSKAYAVAEEFPQHYTDRFDEQNGGEIAVVLVGRTSVDLLALANDEFDRGFFLDDYTRVRLDEVHYEDANGWHVLQAPSDLQALAALDNEARVSVAEHVMENFGYTGKTWHLLEGHRDDPAYNEVLAPLREFVARVVGGYVNVHVSNFSLDREGGAQAMVTGTGTMYVRPTVSTLTILHECAHLISRSTHAQGHDDQFIEVAAALYEEQLGPDASRKFLDIALGT